MDTRTIPPLQRKQIELFWSRVNIGREDECWPWKAAQSTIDGERVYGAFSPNAKQTFGAHRIAYFLSTGDDPVGCAVRHLVCDNPPCCNPKHLAKGSIGDNNKDTKTRGRTAKGQRNGAYTHPEKVNRGSSHGNARLTESQVLNIRAAYDNGMRIIDLAGMYNVSDGTIGYIVKRKTWTHI